MREIDLLKAQRNIDLALDATESDIQYIDVRLEPILETIAKLESLKLQFPELADIFEAALVALRPKAAELSESLGFFRALKVDLINLKKKYTDSDDIHIKIVWKEEKEIMKISFGDDNAIAGAEVKTLDGRDAAYDGQVAWDVLKKTSADGEPDAFEPADNVADLTLSGDKNETCELKAKSGGDIGTFYLRAKADVQAGEGEKFSEDMVAFEAALSEGVLKIKEIQA